MEVKWMIRIRAQTNGRGLDVRTGPETCKAVGSKILRANEEHFLACVDHNCQNGSFSTPSPLIELNSLHRLCRTTMGFTIQRSAFSQPAERSEEANRERAQKNSAELATSLSKSCFLWSVGEVGFLPEDDPQSLITTQWIRVTTI